MHNLHVKFHGFSEVLPKGKLRFVAGTMATDPTTDVRGGYIEVKNAAGEWIKKKEYTTVFPASYTSQKDEINAILEAFEEKTTYAENGVVRWEGASRGINFGGTIDKAGKITSSYPLHGSSESFSNGVPHFHYGCECEPWCAALGIFLSSILGPVDDVIQRVQRVVDTKTDSGFGGGEDTFSVMEPENIHIEIDFKPYINCDLDPHEMLKVLEEWKDFKTTKKDREFDIKVKRHSEIETAEEALTHVLLRMDSSELAAFEEDKKTWKEQYKDSPR